ncbi:phosphatase PAP2 family protein [Leptospira langatensis]|uniref:Phosphatase PAP2 family protein n=1 Tax=Leptospira langatensis TaxID=2484983 RepID=A0A5F1ZW48_9LEPT|nr:phosphatase PAP2 family protein [Leptospira langatensis]TGJ98257.1 phosphatase PAP2 family protein [Leptospira langatensis]TGL43171.1 phosphatase PAP2 family protein [Leptospira langatensis]
MNWEQVLWKEYLFSNSPLEALHISFLKPILDPLAITFHHLGSSLFFMGLVSIIYLCVDRKLGIRMTLGLLLAGILNGTCKALLTSPRPIGLPYPAELGLVEGSYGFPSGHVQTAVVLYGTLFLHLRIFWVRMLTGFAILFMPIARMYVGLHFLGDVIGGFFLGLFVLFGLEFWLQKNPSLLVASGPAEAENQSKLKSYLLLLIAATLPTVLLQDPSQPESTNRSWEQVISASGSLAGFGIAILQNKRSGVDWKRATGIADFLVRIAIVVLGILVFYLAIGKLLNTLLPENPVARYLRYGIVCYYIGYLSPFLLKRIRGGTHLI